MRVSTTSSAIPFWRPSSIRSAQKYAPGHTSFQYRWAALKLRKASNVAGHRSTRLPKISLPGQLAVAAMCKRHPNCRRHAGSLPGLRAGNGTPLYAGETFDLGRRLSKHFPFNFNTTGWSEPVPICASVLSLMRAFRNPDVDSGDAGLATWLVACQYRADQARVAKAQFAGPGSGGNLSDRSKGMALETTANSPDQNGPLSTVGFRQPDYRNCDRQFDLQDSRTHLSKRG